VVHKGHTAALDTMKNLLTWMDDCDSIPTTEIAKLADKRGDLETNMTNILEDIKRQNDILARIAELRTRESNFGNMVQWSKDFQSITTQSHWQKVPDPNQVYHTICSFSGFHGNCHLKCGVRETMEWEVIGKKCSAFNKGKSKKCKHCGHTAQHHNHYRVTWQELSAQNVNVNEDRKRQYLQASYDLRTAEGQRQALENEQAKSQNALNNAVDRLGQLCQEFNALAISGSFSGFIASRIGALEEEQETMKMNGSTPEALEGMKTSIDLLRSQLKVIQMAEDARKHKSSYGGGSST